MSLPTPICRACRRSLPVARTFTTPTINYIPRASFISLTGNTQPQPNQKNADSNGDVSTLAEKPQGPRIPSKRLPLSKVKRAPNSVQRNPGDLLESLFEQSLVPVGTSQENPTPPATSLEPYRNVETLRQMLGNGTHPVDSWNFFVENFSPKPESGGHQALPEYLQSVARQLIRQVIDAKTEKPSSQALPTCTEISSTYLKLGMLTGSDWADMMLGLLKGILDIPQGPDKEMLYRDLLGAWNVACRQGSLSVVPNDTIVLDWSRIPHIATSNLAGRAAVQRRGVIFDAFDQMTPLLRGRLGNKIPLVTLATFVLLEQDCSSDHPSLIQSAPFVSALRSVAGLVGKDVALLGLRTTRTDQLSTNIIDYVHQEWPKIDTPDQPVGKQSGSGPPPSDASGRGTRRLGSIDMFKALKIASRSQDVYQIDRMWLDAARFPVELNEGDSWNKRGFLTPSLYRLFIYSYMKNRKPDRAIDVWNHMVGNKVAPTVETWTSMLEGCRDSKDAKAIEGIWQKMESSGITPDAVCWTSRICGLIECNKYDAALQALDLMGQRWMAAVKKLHGSAKMDVMQDLGNIGEIHKPTIEVINGAVAGFLRSPRQDLGPRVLGWASKFGIHPNVMTYNILLRPLIREGRSKDAVGLLRQMHNAGFEADIVTFTTILDEVLRNYSQTTPQEMQQTITNVFEQMDQAGVQATLHTYGKLIYHMLQAEGGLIGVNVVIDHMIQRGLQPNTYIYTILIDHYFAQKPVNLEAVGSLIERARSDVRNTDKIFWDRVIEGYARAGETAAAMRVLGRINSQDGVAGWYTLTTLLGALVEAQDWESARMVVRNTRADHGGPIDENEKGKAGQHQFWGLAQQLNLIER